MKRIHRILLGILEDEGAEIKEVLPKRGHYQARCVTEKGQKFKMSIPGTPGSHRIFDNFRMVVRKAMRKADARTSRLEVHTE